MGGEETGVAATSGKRMSDDWLGSEGSFKFNPVSPRFHRLFGLHKGIEV